MSVQELIDLLVTVDDKEQDIIAEGYNENVNFTELYNHPIYGLVLREEG